MVCVTDVREPVYFVVSSYNQREVRIRTLALSRGSGFRPADSRRGLACRMAGSIGSLAVIVPMTTAAYTSVDLQKSPPYDQPEY